MAKSRYAIVGEIADFDYHGNWGDFTSPRSLRAFLDSLGEGDEAEIEVNSPGGSVVKGIEMANALKSCKAKTVARVTGLAASMASVVALACDEVEMDEASFFMVHNPWAEATGDAEELRKQAGLLDQMKQAIMSFYRGRFGKRTDDEIAALMDAETWWTASECAAEGVASKVWPSAVKAAASVSARRFEKMPEAAGAFLSRRELTDEGRAELEAAKAAASAAPLSCAGGASPRPPSSAAPDAASWEARYKGASKKINALASERDALASERDALLSERDALASERDALASERDALLSERDALASARQADFDQVKEAGFEGLAALLGAASGFKADLEKRETELADARQQLSHLKETRDLLTGGVLGAKQETYAARMSAAATPEEREELRALKRAGKIN